MSKCNDCKHNRDWGVLLNNYVCCSEVKHESQYKQTYTLDFDGETENEVFIFNDSCPHFEQL